MPVVEIKASASWDMATKQKLAVRANEIIAEILNKPIAVVQTVVTDNVAIAFGAKPTAVSAYITIAQIGSFTAEGRVQLTEALCALLASEGIDPKQIYLHFDGGTIDVWGWLK